MYVEHPSLSGRKCGVQIWSPGICREGHSDKCCVVHLDKRSLNLENILNMWANIYQDKLIYLRCPWIGDSYMWFLEELPDIVQNVCFMLPQAACEACGCILPSACGVDSPSSPQWLTVKPHSLCLLASYVYTSLWKNICQVLSLV